MAFVMAFVRILKDMKRAWESFRSRRRRGVEIREAKSDDAYLDVLSTAVTEWNSPEDEEAFRHL